MIASIAAVPEPALAVLSDVTSAAVSTACASASVGSSALFSRVMRSAAT